MTQMHYVTGKLKLKSKKKKSAAKVEEELEELDPVLSPCTHKKLTELPPITATKIQHDPTAELDQLTDHELKALAVKHKSAKRLIEIANSISYQEQKDKLNERLKSYPMHNDLEGD